MTAAEPDRRTQILEAALACFLERGYRATTIADIRAASGATTGSIYHFFGNKAAIAHALLDKAVAGWTGASIAAQEPGVTAERAITAAVAGLVRWGLKNLALLRFMDEIRTIADTDPDFAPVRSALAEGHKLGDRQYRLFAKRGEVKPMDFALAHSLMLGPAYNYLRLIGNGAKATRDAPEALARAGWDAVRATARRR